MAETITVTVAGQRFAVTVESFTGSQAVLSIAGQRLEVELTEEQTPAPTADRPRQAEQPAPAAAPAAATAPAAVSTSPAKALAAQMPGTVLRINVEAGQQVKAGDVLLVLEAMKMENDIRSDRSGQVARLLVEPGQQVQTGAPLVEFA